MTVADQAEALGLLALAVLAICAFVLTASAMFPAEHRPRTLHGLFGGALLYAAIAVVALLAPHAAAFAAGRVTWYFAVIAGGFAFLASPFVHAALPASVRDGAPGILMLAAAALVLHAVLALA